MSSNLTDIHAIRVFNPVAAAKEHRLKRPFVIYEEPLEPTIFVQPDSPTASFDPTTGFAAANTGAPPFAPGGPLNPYPASAGMAPPSLSLPLGSEMPTNIPGQSDFNPLLPVYEVPPGSGLSAAGGYGSATIPPPAQTQQPMPKPRLPGRVPGKFQPGGGQPPMPNQPMQQPQPRMQNPMPNPMPIPQPPIQPPMGGLQTGAKPRGFKTVPMPDREHPPQDPPKPPGQWVTVDAGRGQPPAYGFLSQTQEAEAGVDTGLEGPSTQSTGRDTGEYGSTGKATGAKSGSGEKGHYVPIQLAGADDVSWVWVPEIDSSYGVKHDRDDKPKVNPLGK